MFMAVAHAHAGDYDYLTFQTSDGTLQSFAVSNLKITVSSGTLVVHNSTTSQTFTLSNLSKMYFSATTTGIQNVNTETADACVQVYSSTGVLVGKYSSADEAKTQLQHGVYVVKNSSQTYKIAIK